MSSGGKSRKNKPTRPGSRSKPSSQNSITACEGVYGNPRLVHSLISLVGSKCTTQVKNGGIYNGIFHTFSPNMDFVLGAAHKNETQEKDNNEVSSIYSVKPMSIPQRDVIVDQLIFKSKDVVCALIHDVDLNYAKAAVKSNGDTIESRTNGSSETRPLEPWDGGGDTMDIGGLEDDPKGSGSATNGWAAEDMFKLNTDKYGVKSSYDPNLPEYTTKLEDENTKEYAEKFARADKLANEIEKSSSYQNNINMEVDDSLTEEERFSAVSRDNPKKWGDNVNKFPSRQRPQRGSGRTPHSMGQYSSGGVQRGSGGPPSSGGYGPSSGRSNTPTNEPTSPGSNSSRPGFNRASSGGSQPHVPPRFSKGHSAPYVREEERAPNRLHDNTVYHSSQKSRQGGNQSRVYSRNHPSPTSEYSHHQSAEAQNQSSPQQQSISRTSSSSSITQQPNSPQWGSKPPPTGPVSDPQHIHNPIPMGMNPGGPNVGQLPRYPAAGKVNSFNSVRFPVQKQCIVPRILVRNHKLIKDKGSDGASYSNVLQGPAPPNKQLPGILPPGGYSIRQSVRYSYTPKGHSPPVTVLPGMQAPGAGGVLRPQQQQPASPIIANPAVPPPQQRYVPVAQSAQPATTPAHPPPQPPSVRSVRGSSSSEDSKSKKANESKIKELKEFGRDFKLPESKTVSDGPKTVSKSSSTGSSQAKVQPRPLRPSSNQATTLSSHHVISPTEHQQQHPQESKPQQHQPKITQQQAPPPPPQQVLQQAQQQIPAAAQQTPQHQQIPAQHPHSSPQIPLPIITTVDQEGMLMPIIQGHPPGQQMIPMVLPSVNMYGSPTIANPALTPTSHPIPQPAINVVSSVRTSAVAPAVNTISAATGFVSPQHTTGPTTAPSVNVDAHQHSELDAPSGEAASSTANKDMSPQTPEGGQLNPDAKEFTPRSFAPKPPTPQLSPTPVTHQIQPTQPTYFPAPQPTIVPQYIVNKPHNHKRVANQAVLSPNGQESHIVSHMTPQIHPTTSGHPYIAAQSHPPYQTPIIIATQGTHHQPITAPQPYDPLMYPIHPVTPRGVPYSAEGQVYIQPHQQQQQQVQAQQMQQPPPPQQQQQSGYIQQTRPQSAHTPNPSHIPPTSPVANSQQAQQQLATVGQGGVPGNPPGPPHLHPPQNMIGQQNYYQLQHHPGQHPIHGNQIMAGSPHGSYGGYSQTRYYMPHTNAQHQHVPHSPAGPPQQGFIQQNVGSNAGQMQPNQGQMYHVQRPQYPGPPQMLQQQQYQQQPN